MRQISLIISILGLSILSLLLIFSTPKEVNSLSDFFMLENNQKVHISGKVTSEFKNQDSSSFVIDKKFNLVVSPPQNSSLINKTISAIGKISIYNNKTTIKVISLKIP